MLGGLVVTVCATIALAGLTRIGEIGVMDPQSASVQSPQCPGDFNGDGAVNLADFLAFAGGFGATSGDANYNARLDLNGSGAIDLADFLAFAGVFGTTCGDPPEGSVSGDRAALVALYNATDGPNWVNSENWLTVAALGDWYGVETDATGRVVKLNLNGAFDYERQLTLPHGLTGPLPLELGNLTNLKRLNLSRNALSGTIPPELGDLANLERLNLHQNYLSGTIPTGLGNLSKLEGLFLGGNALTGLIPPELGSLASLSYLELHGNKLTGVIPQSFLQLDTLELLWLRQEDEGLCVPGSSAFYAWLRGINLRDGGSEILCNATDVATLRSLYEATNGIEWNESAGWSGDGAVEDWHGVTADTLGRVTILDLSHNGLAGRLPPNLGELANMTELRIAGNTGLTGPLPVSLANLSLRALHYPETGLCSPVYASFRNWLSAIPSHEGTGADCARLSDREILKVLYESTHGAEWTNSERWLTDGPLHEWSGVNADQHGRVVELYLADRGLTGPIPPELGGLTNLRVLELAINALTGPIPSVLASLTNMRRLRLFWNQLSGPIPPGLADLGSLKELHLGDNALTGSIPPELGNLDSLEQLRLGGNALTGPIPPELGNLANATLLHLFNNRLTGGIPAELGSARRLKWILLWGNDLKGSIPRQLGNLAALESLVLDNTALSGAIPPELGGLSNLKVLRLPGNDLTGPVPPEFGSLSAVETLILANNDLSGSVPPTFGGMSSLKEVSFTNNPGMEGPLPSELTTLGQLETLHAGGTGLCAPADPDFQAWLDGIHQRRINSCTEAESASAYLTQAVQSRKFPVPLVAGEQALLRVFPTARQANNPGLPEVRARFYVNGHESHVENIRGQPTPIPTEVDESSLSRSVNAEIPGHVVQPGLELVIEVDPNETLDPALRVATRIPETGRLAVEVRAMPLFDLTLIPFLWSKDPDSSIVELIRAMAADPENHEMLGATRTLLPVGDLAVTAHEPVLSSSNSAFVIRDETKAIRAVEGGTGHYMGMMAQPVTGASGVAELPGHVSFAIPARGTIAHELGHNLNLQHAPCQGTPGSDPSYPYPDGLTGAWGYDFDGARLVSPLTPDLMAYCAPTWISDYHFSNALRFRLFDEVTPTTTTAARSLLLWGGVNAKGEPHLYPSFVIDAPAVLPDSVGAHLITGRTGVGDELFSISFTMPATACGDGSSSYAFILPVRPDWAGSLASITLSGPGGSATLDETTDRPMAILRDLQSGQVRGFLSELSAEEAAQAAEGAIAAKPGVQVLFSRGIPGLR